MKRSKLSNEKIENVQFEDKRSTRKASAQGDKNLKRILVLNEIKGAMTLGQDPNQLNFQFVGRK